MEIIIFFKKETALLTKEHQGLCQNGKISYICKEKVKGKYVKITYSKRSLEQHDISKKAFSDKALLYP